MRDSGEPLFESNLIIEYLDSLLPVEQRLVPANGERRWQVLRLQALASGMIDATATRTVESRKSAPTQSPVVLERELGRIDRVLARFESIAKPGQPIAGEKMTAADFILGVALQYLDFRHTPEWRKAAPKLAAWLAPMAQRPSFKTTQPPGFTPPA
ncbi:MAG: glutathione S-transferase C-terminal domain-containing protein [Pseudolabrys sp.]